MQTGSSNVRIIQLGDPVCDEHDDVQFRGKFMDSSHYDLLVDEDADVLKPDGQPLLKLRKGVIPIELCKQAYRAFARAAAPTNQRGVASGTGGTLRELATGGISKYRKSPDVDSGVVGYMDRDSRFPHCRATAYSRNHWEQFASGMAFVRAVDSVFREAMPDRYAAQLDIVQRTHEDWIIHGTAFSTITVNRNFRTAAHKDAGDYAPGFGVLSAIIRGEMGGFYLVFPRWRVAANFRTTDVLLADVHEYHGNTEPIGRLGHYERISLVFYYRAGLVNCGSADDELKRGRRHMRGAGEATR